MNVTNILGCYFFSNILLTNTGVIINLNLKLTTQDPSSQLIFWTQKIPELSLKPALLLWLIYILFSNRTIFSKLIHSSIFLTALVSIELIFSFILIIWNGKLECVLFICEILSNYFIIGYLLLLFRKTY